MVQGLVKPYKQEIEHSCQRIFDEYENQKSMVHFLVINNGEVIETSGLFPNPLHPMEGLVGLKKFYCLVY